MLKISDAVKQVLHHSDVALLALNKGWLNLSAYAESIQPKIEGLCKKPVKTGSIVVALSRYKTQIDTQEPILPDIILEELTIKSNLVAVTYDKTGKTLQNLVKLYQRKHFEPKDYLSITQGVSEVSIIIEEHNLKKVLDIYVHRQPKDLMKNLVSLTLHVSPEYIHTPNTFYALARRFALSKINIVDVISTFTEMSFIIEEKQTQEAFETLNALFKESQVQK